MTLARRVASVEPVAVTAGQATGAVATTQAHRGGGPRRGAGPRQAPGVSWASRRVPMRTRTRRTTGWPTASHIRRTWRLRPSWMVMRSTPGLGWRPWPARSTPSSSSTPSRSRRRAPGADRAAGDLGQVLLLHPVAGVGEPVGQIAVVGQQQQPLGVGVEAADGEHPRLGRHQVDHGRAALRVARRGDHPGRLVQQVVDEAGAHADRARRRPRPRRARGRPAGRARRPRR